MLFEYTVLRNSARRQGTIEADSKQAAVNRLRNDGCAILDIRASTKNRASGGETGGRPTLDAIGKRVLISKGQVEIALRQLASLLHAGVPIMTALQSVEKQAPGALRGVFARIAAKVRQGNSLQRSLEEEAPFMGRVSLGLIGVGEANGTLDDMLTYSANLMEQTRKLRGQIVEAFAYPAIVVLGAMGVSYYMVAVVFPKIMTFIQKQGKNVPLPWPTRVLIRVSDFAMDYGLYVLAAPIVIAVVLLLARRVKRFGERIDENFLRIPLLGRAFRDHSNTMWCRTLGALLGNGIDAVTALTLIQQTMGNMFYALQFESMREIVRQGRSLTHGLGKTALHRLCPMASAMVSVSEESGGLDESLEHVARYSEEHLARRVALLSKMVEPAIFVVVGGIVGFVYFAFFMAMLSVTKSAT